MPAMLVRRGVSPAKFRPSVSAPMFMSLTGHGTVIARAETAPVQVGVQLPLGKISQSNDSE
jgi:hypothetical protein